MKKGEKYNSFYDKIVDYQIRKLRMLKNESKKDGAGGFSSEYKTLVKAKKDIKDRITESIDGILLFTEIISTGFYKKKIQEKTSRINPRKDNELINFRLMDEPVEIRHELIKEYNNFVSDVFNEERIKQIIDMIFEYNRNIVKNKMINDGKKIVTEEYKLSDYEAEYMINVARLMVIKSIGELKKYLDPEYSKYLEEDLARVVEICNLIANKPDKKIITRLPEIKSSKGYN